MMYDAPRMPRAGEDNMEEELENTTKRSWPKMIALASSIAAVTVFMISGSVYNERFSNSAVAPISFAASADQKYSALPEKNQRALFEQFIVHYGKTYHSSAEYNEKFLIFRDNLKAVDDHMEKQRLNGGKAKFGITKFSDLRPSEFKTRFLTAKKPLVNAAGQTNAKMGVASKPKSYTGEETEVDWAGVYTTAVKDQGYCGSCWAFSATEQIESDAIREGIMGTENALSPQQIVSCDQHDWGCDGGYTENAYIYVKQTGGLEKDLNYPYSTATYMGSTGECESNAAYYDITLDEYFSLDGEEEMKDHVFSTGPLSICIDATIWSNYVSGVISASECGTEVNHCVQVTGINLSDETSPYWIVRNSWGESWGLDGYIHLEYGTDACAITTDPTFTSVRTV